MARYTCLEDWEKSGEKYCNYFHNGLEFRFARRADGDFDLQSKLGTQLIDGKYVPVYETIDYGPLEYCWYTMLRVS